MHYLIKSLLLIPWF